MTTSADFALVIVGGGLAFAKAIASYRDAGGDGRIALLSRDEGALADASTPVDAAF